MTATLPIGIVMAFTVNLFVGIYFAYLCRKLAQSGAYQRWAVACGLFSAGIVFSVASHFYGSVVFFKLIACTCLFGATYALFTGVTRYEYAHVEPKLARQTRFFFFVGLGIIFIASVLGNAANAITSLMMAVMLLLSEGGLHQQKKTSQLVHTVIRATLIVHAFVLFFQGAVIFVQMASGGESDIVALFELTLLSHLLLTVATASLLPFLHMLTKQEYWKKVASEDDLTGLLGRRAFISSALSSINHLENSSYSLLIVDIDYFKQINDEYGHLAGDEVLRTIAETLKNGIRGTDIIGRLGGEEFAILMPGLSVDHAHIVANRLLNEVADHRVRFDGAEIQATVSIGIAASNGIPGSWDELFNQADNALYSAKEKGRNLVFTFASSS